MEVDVLVVGAGPAGLTAAGDLARRGRKVAVLERWPQRNPSSRAFATMARTLELLDARGLADELLAHAARTPGVDLFGGARLDLTGLPSRYRFAMITPQTNVDAALERYAIAQGADLRRGLEVIGLEQDADGVTVLAQHKGDSTQRETWRARYVIGADGAHSTVRDLLGIPFPGRTVLSSIVLADVRLCGAPGGSSLSLANTPDLFGFLVPYGRDDVVPDGGAGDGTWFRTMLWDRRHQVPDGVPVTEQEIVDLLHRTHGAHVDVREVGWHSRFHCDERQVAQYRHGRVLLAGDAAHVHSPVGGQGMNTGIQDAVNLAWKLDAVVGGATDEVLDSYQTERHPIGARVVRQSGMLARLIVLHGRVPRALRNLLVPALLRVPAVRHRLTGVFSGVGLRYPCRPGDHELVGRRADEIPLDGPRLAILQRRPGFLLVRERGTVPADAGLPETERTDDGPAVLVRPDGYIAWAGSSADREGWSSALEYWTGRSSVPVGAV